MRRAPRVELTEADRKRLAGFCRGRSSPLRLQERAAIVLLAAEGLENKDIAARLRQDKMKVGRWRSRYVQFGMAGIMKDKSRPGRIPPLAAAVKSKIIAVTLGEKPPSATHWSRATMAARMGVSPSSVGRVWAASGLKPHLVKGFKLSNDKQFEEKLHDIVGLYLNPPEHAIVLACDEKSQIQALDRTQPGLPLKRGRCQTMTHDYKRNGTTSLFAAMNVADGKVMGTCMGRHRHQEWIRFLKLIVQDNPGEYAIHIICDNYATHKHPRVKAWQKRNPRFHFHFTPTSASWLNMVERFFRNITEQRIRRGVFHSVSELTRAIEEYISAHNEAPAPFVWTASATDILEKVKRGRARLHNMRSA